MNNYTDKDFKALELTAIEFAQQYSFRYIGVDAKKLNAEELQILLIKLTVSHLVSLKACPIIIDKFQDWFLICSNTNWHKLGRTESLGTEELFYHPVAALEMSDRETRSEFLLYVFSNELFVIENDTEIILKGDVDKKLIQSIKDKAPYSNIVVFK